MAGKKCVADCTCYKHFHSKQHNALIGMGVARAYEDKRRTNGVRKCDVQGCSKQHRARGYCMDHYNEFIRTPKRANA